MTQTTNELHSIDYAIGEDKTVRTTFERDGLGNSTVKKIEHWNGREWIDVRTI